MCWVFSVVMSPVPCHRDVCVPCHTDHVCHTQPHGVLHVPRHVITYVPCVTRTSITRGAGARSAPCYMGPCHAHFLFPPCLRCVHPCRMLHVRRPACHVTVPDHSHSTCPITCAVCTVVCGACVLHGPRRLLCPVHRSPVGRVTRTCTPRPPVQRTEAQRTGRLQMLSSCDPRAPEAPARRPSSAR